MAVLCGTVWVEAFNNMAKDFTPLLKSLAIKFNNIDLLKQALTHRSANKNHNERLEFLGDSILNFVIADALYQLKSDLREGDLSRLRASLVCGTSLAELAAEIGLGDYLTLGSGELTSGGFRRLSILEDAFEAMLGAYYLDQGFDACKQFIHALFKNKLANLPSLNTLKDPKTRLQEYLQSKRMDLPVYNVVKTSGKAHDQRFTVRCEVQAFGIDLLAESKSRRKAEQMAAEQALAKIGKKKTL